MQYVFSENSVDSIFNFQLLPLAVYLLCVILILIQISSRKVHKVHKENIAKDAKK